MSLAVRVCVFGMGGEATMAILWYKPTATALKHSPARRAVVDTRTGEYLPDD